MIIYIRVMLNLPEYPESYWKSSTAGSKYPKLAKNISVDVIIVGGGITGLTAAYLLKQSDQKVAVLEKNTIGSGTTGGTTGKVTAQHGLVYSDLVKQWGESHARMYAEANLTAVERIDQLIKREKIDCSWRRADNFVFTTDVGQVNKFKQEAKTAASLGLPASFTTKTDLPFKVKGAVKFSSQATFNVSKYILGLAKAVNGNGSYVFENSNVKNFRDGKPASVRTDLATVTAKDIIVATKVPASPLIARGAYCLLEYPHTSYVVAGQAKYKVKGMYISPDKNHYSILPVSDGSKNLLLIGGGNHIPGPRNQDKRYQKLADYANEHFGVTEIEYRWKAMDYISYDNVPLIGKLYPWSDHLYVATAFKKWGLSTSMVAGMILHDLILGEENFWASTFDSARLKPVWSIPRKIAKSLSS